MRKIAKWLLAGASFLLMFLALTELDKVKKELGEIEEEMDSWYYGDY